MQIGIIDENQQMLFGIKHYVEVMGIGNLHLIEGYFDINELLNSGKCYDVIIVDIDIPNGYDLDDAKRFINQKTDIIYITNCQDKLNKVYDKNVVACLLKSQVMANIKTTVLNVINRKYQKDDILVGKSCGLYRFNGQNIIYIEYVRRYLYFFKSNSNFYIPYMSLKEMMKYLPDNFIQINKSQIININKVLSMDGCTIKMNGTDKLFEISRRRKKEVFNLLIKKINIR